MKEYPNCKVIIMGYWHLPVVCATVIVGQKQEIFHKMATQTPILFKV